jgi:uncharacterized membrane protein YadS
MTGVFKGATVNAVAAMVSASRQTVEKQERAASKLLGAGG